MRVIFTAALLIYSIIGSASSPEEEVLRVVTELFDGMRKGDSTMVRGVFSPDARLITILEKNGLPEMRVGSVDRFVTAVGTPHDDVWDEVIWGEEVKIDGRLAQVWAKYALFAGEKFIHCGVDAFHLFKGTDGWRIFQLTDTRQTKDCETPPER